MGSEGLFVSTAETTPRASRASNNAEASGFAVPSATMLSSVKKTALNCISTAYRLTR